MMKNKLVALFLTAVFIVVVPALGMGEKASANEVIPPNTQGFIGSWHPVPECGQCHVTLLSEKELRAKLGSCNCHKEAYTSGGNIDMEKIRTVAHGSKTCVDCHLGSGLLNSAGEIPSDDLHQAHVNVDCQACHGVDTDNPIVPETGNCNFCHLGDGHSVHGTKTGELCVSCHGAFGLDYKEEGYQMVEGIPVVVKPEEVKYPTILNTLKALITFIIGG